MAEMNIIFTTNLDMYKKCKWPHLDVIPPIGSKIQAVNYHNELEVYSIRIKNRRPSTYFETDVIVELHYPKYLIIPNVTTLQDLIDRDKLRPIE